MKNNKRFTKRSSTSACDAGVTLTLAYDFNI